MVQKRHRTHKYLIPLLVILSTFTVGCGKTDQLDKHLLTTTSHSITDIETLCGFNTPVHFSRLFNSVTGMSPTEYRNKK